MNVQQLSTGTKLFNNPHYVAAKAGSLVSAMKLIESLFIDYTKFSNFNGFVVPVYRKMGNMIPWVLAKKISDNSPAMLWDKIHLANYLPGNEMALRMMHEPMYFGQVIKGKFILVDDFYTTGSTLIHLKKFIASNKDCTVIKAYTLCASKHGNSFEANRIMQRSLLARFPDIEKYFNLNLLTVPHIKYLLRFKSISDFFNRYDYIQAQRFLT